MPGTIVSLHAHPDDEAILVGGTPRVYEATFSRDHFIELAAALADELPPGVEVPDPAQFDLGMPDARITTRVDVSSVLDRKRAAMAAHASQIPPDSFFLSLGPDAFARVFGLEWFIRTHPTPSGPETWLF